MFTSKTTTTKREISSKVKQHKERNNKSKYINSWKREQESSKSKQYI